ncbi:zinc knuckle CX2CX4HX4C containing protein [Tanacetum coccineum]
MNRKAQQVVLGVSCTEDHIETMEALGSICNSIKVDRNNADVIPCKVSYADDSINLNVDESTIPSDPIVQSVDINKSTSYAGVAGGSAKDQPNVNSNFRTLVADPVFNGVNISIPRKVVKKQRKLCDTHRLKRIMMNSKGFFFFKFDSWAGLEAVLEGGPCLIRKSPIILKKWSMDTRLLKEELTHILIWVKLHDRRLMNGSKYGKTKKRKVSPSATMAVRFTEEEEDVENMYDESANLIQNTKAGGSSSFTAAAG